MGQIWEMVRICWLNIFNRNLVMQICAKYSKYVIIYLGSCKIFQIYICLPKNAEYIIVYLQNIQNMWLCMYLQNMRLDWGYLCENHWAVENYDK